MPRPGGHAEPARRAQRAQRAGAIAVATELELPDAPVVRALAEFRGVAGASSATANCRPRAAGLHADRRLRPPPGPRWPRCWPPRAAPSRAGASGAGLPAAPLHPHARLLRGFVKVMGSADAVLLAEVYAAGEAPIVAADGRALARAVRGSAGTDRCSSTTSSRCRRPSPRTRATATWSSPWAPDRSARCRRNTWWNCSGVIRRPVDP